MGPRIPRMLSERSAKLVTVAAILGTLAVLGWMLLRLREDPPRADRGPLAIPSVSATASTTASTTASATATPSAPRDAR